MITESSEVPRFCGISGAHRAYPAAGGRGILVGDRQLPHRGVESISPLQGAFFDRRPIDEVLLSGVYASRDARYIEVAERLRSARVWARAADGAPCHLGGIRQPK